MKKNIFLTLLIAFQLVHAVTFNLENKIEFNKLEAEEPTLQTVLNNYYQAVAGDKNKLEEIKTLVSEGEMTFSTIDTKADITIKYEMPNKFISIINIMGQKIIQGFDGSKPISNVSSIEEDKAREMKDKKGIFSELYYTAENSEFLGKDNLEGKEVYKIKIKDKDIENTVYFDANSGLKIREVIVKEKETMTKDYSEYKDFGGFKLATKIKTTVPGQIALQTVNKYIINPTLSDKDFKL